LLTRLRAIRGEEDVRDSVVVLVSVRDGLDAECANGRTVRLADSDCPSALQLALLDEIRRAAADDRHAVVVMPPAERGSFTWRREYADALLELLAASDDELPVSLAELTSGPIKGRLAYRCRMSPGWQAPLVEPERALPVLDQWSGMCGQGQGSNRSDPQLALSGAHG
jgi:hypothetical protein